MDEINDKIKEEIAKQMKERFTNLFMSTSNFNNIQFMLQDVILQIKNTISNEVNSILSKDLKDAKRQLENIISPKITNRLIEFERQIKGLLESHTETITEFHKNTIFKFNNQLSPLNNIYLITEKINVSNRINAEEFVKNKLEQSGFKVVRETKGGGIPDFSIYKRIGVDINISDMDYYNLLINEMITKNDGNNLGKLEVPIYSEHPIFVEVKTNGDGLRFNQLQWIRDHPEHKVIIYCIEQVIKST